MIVFFSLKEGKEDMGSEEKEEEEEEEEEERVEMETVFNFCTVKFYFTAKIFQFQLS